MPGYLLALILIRFSSATFVSVAFDSGGVAIGPMTVTFIMALAVGAASGIEDCRSIKKNPGQGQGLNDLTL